MLRAADTTCKTDTGRQRRDNEDSAFARAPVFVVADGMGGAQAGEVASRIAVEAFEQGLPDSGSPEERLASRVREANQQIYERSRADRGRAGMGTTLTAAYVDDTHVAIAHVGDSRAYLFRDGTLQRLTQDHSLVDELVRRGKLTEEQAAEHPQRSIITRALGPEPDVEVDTWTYPARAGDVILLCSDGLTSMISEERVRETLAEHENLDDAGDALIREANEAGGRDNITVVLFRLEEVGADDGAGDDTMVGVAVPRDGDAVPTEEGRSGATAVAIAPPPTFSGPRRMEPAAPGTRRLQPRPPSTVRRERRFVTPIAALLSVVIVVGLIGAGGYLASRQLYFVGTNAQGIVTVYRGLPYSLPFGVPLYETYYVSGVPAQVVPAARRGQLLNNNLRSQTDATSLVMDLEQGRISP
ncbi:MAG TPA: Stp1/IreP family PP2C-type Ser/Thr phosphatase [Solirubrobacteraceae bacterium]|nr:Stp1/IreP family PP2C-type Ser/Thr phosphatase [Solirubrobacteraceae bacterium]HUA50286.1 Stp1/IreP family PP2C-type Ser/Thr phosphatase [Solirubrobacteraceae bacterium]